MVVGGMTVVERVLREAARAGVTRAYVRGRVPNVPTLPIEIAVGDPPPGTKPWPATTIAGVEIVDAASQRAASRALLQSLRRPYDGLGDRYVIRAVSIRLTGALCNFAVTPNQITFINIA